MEAPDEAPSEGLTQPVPDSSANERFEAGDQTRVAMRNEAICAQQNRWLWTLRTATTHIINPHPQEMIDRRINRQTGREIHTPRPGH